MRNNFSRLTIREAAVFCAVMSLLPLLPAQALTTSTFDGRYVPRYLYDAGEAASFCPREGLAPYDIADGQFLLENETCALTEPTEIRDLDAMLFDAVCDGIEDPAPERLLIARQFDGVLVLRGGSHFDLVTCPAGG